MGCPLDMFHRIIARREFGEATIGFANEIVNVMRVCRTHDPAMWRNPIGDDRD